MITSARKVLLGYTTAALMLGSGTLFAAAQETAILNVSANVPAKCRFGAGSMTLTFADYDATANSTADGSMTMSIQCTKGTAYNILLSGGNAGSVSARKMSDDTDSMGDGVDLLGYQLYSDSGRTTAWGETIGTDTVAHTATTSAAQDYTVYGRISAGQDVETGTYTDQVTITLDY